MDKLVKNAIKVFMLFLRKSKQINNSNNKVKKV